MQFVDTTTPTNPQNYVNIGFDDNPNKYGDQSFQVRNDWLTMYMQNAYNTAMTNYMNEYNSPLQQMLRYQDAGLSKWLAAQSPDPGNMNAPHPGAAPKGNFRSSTSVQRQAQIMQNVKDVVDTARQIYTDMTFTYPANETNLKKYQNEASKAQSEADWAMYWNYGPGMGPNSPAVESSPRAVYMQNSSDRIQQQVAQLQSLINTVYPTQAARNTAAAAFQDYQTQLQHGKNDAILNINTGYKWLDQLVMFLAFLAVAKI